MIKDSSGNVMPQCDQFHFWSLHTGGSNWAFADGSVRFMLYSADNVLQAMGTRDGGEVVDLP
jgi:prepilin-type processing-associated H-X9-DG protein